jgi:hypothetical protein
MALGTKSSHKHRTEMGRESGREELQETDWREEE